MIGTEESNNVIMRANADSIKKIKFRINYEEWFKLCSYENRQTGVNGGLKHNKIQDISKLNKKWYCLPKNIFNTRILRKKLLVSRKVLRRIVLFLILI